MDLPIPGSPPIKTIEPGTIPPPKAAQLAIARLPTSNLAIPNLVKCQKALGLAGLVLDFEFP